MTSTELEEIRKIVREAEAGIEAARISASKMASIGVTMDISKLEDEVAKLQAALANAEQEYAAQSAAPKPTLVAPTSVNDERYADVLHRLEKIEMNIGLLKTEVRALKGGKQ